MFVRRSLAPSQPLESSAPRRIFFNRLRLGFLRPPYLVLLVLSYLPSLLSFGVC